MERSSSDEASRLIISMNHESLLQKQEYANDGAVDIFGMPASISKTGGKRAAFFILAYSFCSALAYGGVYINLVLYLKGSLHEDNASAAMTVNSLLGFVYLVSLFGAVISDGYLGRYWSTTLFLGIYLMGYVAVSLMTYLNEFPSDTSLLPKCPRVILKFLLFVFLYISALGFGASQPCVTSLGAGVVLFLLGTPIYRLHRPIGNPFLRVAQVVVATVRKWRVRAPMGNHLHELHNDSYHKLGTRKLSYSKRFRYLDKAATPMTTEIDEKAYQNAWHLCTVTQVEELKCLLSVMPVFVAVVIYGTMFSQLNTLFVEQSAMMDTHLSKLVFPPTYMALCESTSVCIWAILFENIIQPIVSRKLGQRKGLTSLQRIGTGLIFTMLSMAAAALVEKSHRDIALRSIINPDTSKPSQMHVLWQIPQYVFMGASEVFTSIGQMQFFYDQAPDGLRVTGSALFSLALACGSYLGNTMISITKIATTTKDSPRWIPNDLNKGRLDLFFGVLSFICLLNFLYFLICAQFYKYKAQLENVENI